MINRPEASQVADVFTEEYWGELHTAEQEHPEPRKLVTARLHDKGELKATLGLTALSVLTGTTKPQPLVEGSRIAFDYDSHPPAHLLPGAVLLMDHEYKSPATSYDKRRNMPEGPDAQEEQFASTNLSALIRSESKLNLSSQPGAPNDQEINGYHMWVHSGDHVYHRRVNFSVVADTKAGRTLADAESIGIHSSGKVITILLKGLSRTPAVVGQTVALDEESRYRLRAVEVCRAGKSAEAHAGSFQRLRNWALGGA